MNTKDKEIKKKFKQTNSNLFCITKRFILKTAQEKQMTGQRTTGFSPSPVFKR